MKHTNPGTIRSDNGNFAARTAARVAAFLIAVQIGLWVMAGFWSAIT